MTTAVLGDWVDPDGDPFFLRSSSAEEPDAISSTAEGVVVFDEAGGAGSTRGVSLVVSDGRDEAAGVLTVSVRAPGDVPLIAEPFVALATAGEEIRIDPLRHVRGGSGQVRLSAVPAKPDVTADARFRRRQLPLHERCRAHPLPRILGDRRDADGDRPRARRRRGSARPRHDADHGAAHRIPARGTTHGRRRAGHRHRPHGRCPHRHGPHGLGRRRRGARGGRRPSHPPRDAQPASRDRIDDIRLSGEQRPRRGRRRGDGRRGPQSHPHAAARRGTRHDLGPHRRRRRHRRARQRRAPRRAPAHARARPRREAGRGPPVRRGRPPAVLRTRRGGGVRGDVPGRRLRRPVRDRERPHLGARRRSRDELGAGAEGGDGASPRRRHRPHPDSARRRRSRRGLGAAARTGVQSRSRRRRGSRRRTGSSTRRASTPPAPTRSSTPSSMRSARGRRARSASGSPRGSTAPARRSPSRTSSPSGLPARSPCGCSRTTPTPTAAR